MIQLSEPTIGDQEAAAVESVLRSGFLAQGPRVAEFEVEFAETIGVDHCVAVNSGTSALHLMLLAAGIGEGDEVIVPSFSFAATANSVALTGARVVFADVDYDSMCLSPETIMAVGTSSTTAVMPVHLYGNPAGITGIKSLCEDRGWTLFEDSAQAHLANNQNGLAGSFGLSGAFSFYPTKNMTTGEGGAIVTNSEGLARKARLLRNQGMAKPYENEIVGYNNRMTDIAAAIGLVQLQRLEEFTEKRIHNALTLNRGLAGNNYVETPTVEQGDRHVFHQYTLRVPVETRNALKDFLKGKEIDSGVYYANPIHNLPSFSHSGVSLPVTEKLAKEVLSLPVHPMLKEQDLEKIVETVNDYFAKNYE